MSSGNNFGLSDTELKIALCALKVTLIDGKVEKGHLARLTGHNNADSAYRVWYMVKKKLMETNASPSGSATSAVDVDTPTKGPKKTPAKMRTPNPKKQSKKRSKKQADEKEDDSDVEVDEKPAKRLKKEVADDAGLETREDEI